jgi:hypothetical protein
MKAWISILFFIFLFTISAKAQKSDAEKFVGQWVANDAGYAMEANFKADGTGVVDGDRVTWTVESGSLAVTVDGEKETYKYVFNENGFRVSGGNLDLPLNFKKVSGSTSSAVQNQNADASRKHIDNTLVGKWCYVNVTSANTGGSSSEQCITINANGTYEYYSDRSSSGANGGTSSQASDRGTWWVQGTRVHYNSQAQGQGSYELVKKNHPKTGDPMIVLDGTAYVTFFKKSPW